MVLNNKAKFIMQIESIGTYTPPHYLSMEDRHQVAEKFMTGSEKEKWFLPYIFEKSHVERRHCVVLEASEGDLMTRQDFFHPAATYVDGLGPSTGARMKQYEEHAIGMAREACT